MLDPNNTRVGPARSDEGEYTADDQVVRPAHGSNKSSKDFKKVLSKGAREQKEDEENATAGMRKPSGKTFADAVGDEDTGFGVTSTKDDEENASAGGPFSLFGKGSSLKEGKPKQPARVESPAEMFKHMASRDKTTEKDISPAVVVEHPEEKDVHTHYTQEQPDLAYINPLQTAPTEAATPNVKSIPEPVRKDLGALIDQIVKSMYTVKQEGRTETVLTLQHPPLLKDAQIVVTSFDSARGQFNISFENLTQQAQAILSAEANKLSLLTALHDKGYNVQILTMTTIQENIIPIDDTALRDQREREGRGQGQQQHQDDEEERG